MKMLYNTTKFTRQVQVIDIDEFTHLENDNSDKENAQTDTDNEYLNFSPVFDINEYVINLLRENSKLRTAGKQGIEIPLGNITEEGHRNH